MLKLHVSQIHEDASQRKDFPPGKLQALADSINTHGLFHPIHVVKDEEGYRLIHGRRRLRAIRDYLWPTGGTLSYSNVLFEEGFVPATLTPHNDELKLEEAEFAENEDREPLTWQERAAATARIASIRRRQAASSGALPPSVAAIAEEVRGRRDGDFHEETRREIIVAEFLGDAEIKASKTLDEAWKKLKAKESAEKNRSLAEKMGQLAETSWHRVENAEAVEWMRAQPSNTFDVILTDPPYGIDAQDFGDADGKLITQTHDYDDSYASWARLMRSCVVEWFRLAKPQAHAYICCDIDNFHDLREFMGSAGWRVHRTPLVIYKTDGNRVPWPKHGPQRKWELVLYALKGDRETLGIFSDVIPTVGDQNLGHGAQKPVALFRELLRRSARPGDTVLDTFAGTGTILQAAHSLKVRATAIELDPSYYGICLQRLKVLT